MINKEFGFQEILLHIFKLESESDFDKSEYWADNSISEKGYYKIENYINTTRNEFSIFLIMGIIAAYACKDSADILKSLDKKVEQIILNNKRLISELDQIPDTTEYLTNLEEKLHLADDSMFSKLLDNLSNFRFRGQSIFKIEMRLRGVEGLLLGASMIHPKEFKQWYLKTQREDLKAIYIHNVLNPLLEKNHFTSSEITFVKAYHLIIRFGIGKYEKDLNDLLPRTENISNITIETGLNEKEKLYFILCYFRYKNNNSKDNPQISSAENDLGFFAENFNNLTEEIIQEYSNNFSYCEILYKAICYIQSDNKKKQLLRSLVKGFNCDFLGSKNVMDYFQEAKLHAEILHNIAGENYIREIENKFDNIYNIMNIPYLIYRKRREWDDSILQLRYYFIIILIFYRNANILKLNHYADMVKSSECGFEDRYRREYELFIKSLYLHTKVSLI